MKRFKLLLSSLKGSKKIYLTAIICCLASVWISLYVPLITKIVIDSIIGKNAINEKGLLAYLFSFRSNNVAIDVTIYALVGVVFTLIASLLQFIYGSLVSIVSQRAGKNMRDRLYSHIQRLDYEYHSKVETGDLIQRCTTDIDNSVNFISDHFINVIRVIFIMIVTITIMINLDIKMSVVSMTLIPAMFIYSFIFFKKVQKSFERQEETESKLSSVLQENLTGVRVVKAFARQDYEIAKFTKANQDNRSRTMDIIKAMSGFWSTSDGLSFIQIGVVVGFGCYFVITGSMTVGIIVAFFSYIEKLMWPVKQLGRLLAESGKTSVSLKRINEVFENKIEDLFSGKSAPKIKGCIEFKNVSFSYPNGTEVLNNISFRLEAGQTVAIIGPTGSGKSTLVNLLQRLYDSYTGHIEIDGVNIRDINKKYLRSNVSLILQEPFLFNKSVKDNVGITSDSYEIHEIHSATEISCVHSSILDFDKGYETLVGEGGVTLSGGQKQRLAIARTLIKKNPVVIFDDSLSAVDTETDRVIREKMKDGSVKPTTIIISHRVSTIKEADLIIVLEKGEITAMGNHDEICKSDNLYKRILDIQNDIEKEFHTILA